MLYPIKVLTLDIGSPISDIKGINGYLAAQLLITFHGQPIGYCKLGIIDNEISRDRIISSILAEHGSKIIQYLLKIGLANPSRQGELIMEELLALKPWKTNIHLPKVTVAVCTRDRTEQLEKCLVAIGQLDYSELDIVIIDNAPSTSATEDLIKDKYPNFRYFKEENPGLNWARNRAILEAAGEVIAYADDDVLVDTNWVKSIGELFGQHPEVMAVTGLVVPAELETEAQVMFEAYGGFGRGFERRWHRVHGKTVPWHLLGTGQFGTGANMAFRKSVFQDVGFFDPALDVGTVTNGGGDLEIFFRVLKHGHTLVYEPAAMVRHCHRRTYSELAQQISNNSKGLVGYMVRSCRAYPDQLVGFLQIWFWYLRHWVVGRMVKSRFKPSAVPAFLYRAELTGCFSFGLYGKAKKRADLLKPLVENILTPSSPYSTIVKGKEKNGTAIRLVDLSRPISSLNDIGEYPRTRIFFKWEKHFLDHLDVANHYGGLSSDRILELVVNELNIKLLQPSLQLDRFQIWGKAIRDLSNNLGLGVDQERHEGADLLPTTASIVIATYDRPSELQECLTSLCHQKTAHQLEIIVVDNHPSSGLTPPVVSRFPNVLLVSEQRKGLSYARNAGINASTGEFIISTDDDVIIPEKWVDDLLKPFLKADVMVVTGNVLPHSLENDAQNHFEMYGGLGRGYDLKVYDNSWFSSFGKHAVPTWGIGACANAAFRSEIFINEKIGLLEEVLGPGMPSGVGEDTYLFYKVLREGFTIIYEPKAYVWHKHRKTNRAFRIQLYNYSKGHVCYHLVTGIQDNDWRGLLRIFYTLPKYHLSRVIRRIIGRSDYPIKLILIEIAGNAIGPLALLLSWVKVKRLAKSHPHAAYSSKSSGSQGYESLRVSREKLMFK